MVEEQLVNGDGQINIGRHPPLGEIRGMGSRQHRQSLTAGTSFTVPFSLIFIQIHGNFSFRGSSSASVKYWAFPFLSQRNKTDLQSAPLIEFLILGRTMGFLKEGRAFDTSPLKSERIPKLSPNFSTNLVDFILVTPYISGTMAFKPFNLLRTIHVW